jgi:Zn-dependent protease
LSIHEYAHARVARWQGDYTAEQLGRVTLNPLAHIDPIGTIVVPLVLLVSSGGRVGFGWAKPVPINPFAFKHPRRGVLMVSLAGPASNICLALAAGIGMRLMGSYTASTELAPLYGILYSVTIINLYLAFFNLIPIPPLDGSGVVSSILPVEYAQRYERIGKFGTLLVLGLIVLGGIGGVGILQIMIGTPARLLFRLFTGI